MCAPVNHPPTCSRRVSNVSKPTAHRVDTVLVTFPKRFHTVCEHVPACQTSAKRAPDVYVTCKYRAQRVYSDRPAVFYRATSVRLPYFPPFVASRWQYKSPTTCLQSVWNKIVNADFYCNTYFGIYVLHSIMPHSLLIWLGNTTLSITIISINDKHCFQHLNSKNPPRLCFFFLRSFGIHHQ